MYNKLIKKYYLYKLFTLSIPKKKGCNQACFLLCRYFIKNTPYGNIQFLIKEIYKMLSIFASTFRTTKLVFFCSYKLFSLNSIFLKTQELKYID